MLHNDVCGKSLGKYDTVYRAADVHVLGGMNVIHNIMYYIYIYCTTRICIIMAYVY